MRKVTQTIATAFLAGKSASLNNTKTDGQHVWLHGNLIASKNPDGSVNVTLAGWNSATTRDRLNGLIRAMGGRGGFFQRNHCAMICHQNGDSHIDPSDVVTVLADGAIVL